MASSSSAAVSSLNVPPSTPSSAAVTFHNSDYDLWDAWLHKIYESTQQDNWFMPSEEVMSTGVAMRVDEGFFRVFPYENPALVPFEAAVRRLNPVVAVKMRSAAVHAAIRKIGPQDESIYIDQNTRIQIIDSIDLLPQAEKDQCGAFIRDERSVVLWSYHLEHIIPLCKDFEEKLIKHIWRTRNIARKPLTASTATSLYGAHSRDDSRAEIHEKAEVNIHVEGPEDDHNKEAADLDAARPEQAPPPSKKSSLWGWWRLQPPYPNVKGSEESDVEKAKRKERKLVLIGPLYAGCGAGLSAYFATAGISNLIQQWALDGDFTRFALMVTLPVIFCVSIFFCLQLIGNLCLMFGPVAQYHENSMYYSAVIPEPNPEVDNNLPHVTIQLPVYKESLETVIAPSVFSVKKAMQTYARQGGTSAIFICDDGLQSLPEDVRQERIAFYANHNIGWVARPPHQSAPDGFKRAGKFKKASNMNYGLEVSLKLERHLAKLEADGAEDDPEECLEDRAMKMAQEEMFEETGRRWKPWCANGKSMRIGEIILIIDADTIIPEDCFRDAAREMAESADVAIIQHESDVMQVANHYFENGITHFTRRINKCISLGCANGEVAPFVGHNAFLRWSAVQDASFIDADGKRKQWSEANVSEDFDLALRLLLKGYNLRWATYSNGGFKEGVSLTVVDELARWQKYAYGCNEIIFNPFIHWWRRGPISAQLRGFVWSKAPLHYKIGMMSYMFSYYGIAAAVMGSVLNYLLLGLAPQIDRFYLHSFEIFLACTVVFPGIGNLGYTLLEYRLGQRNFFSALFENLRWVPFFTFFFGGLSIHLSTALLAHLFSYDMTWGSTGKEVERSSFWIEVPRIWKGFKLTFIICFLCIAMMVIFTTPAIPFQWQIHGWEWALIIPLALTVGCHMLLPGDLPQIVLNPWLMIFSY
ncbi:glycosyl transferase family group 2-domain-containing protein [Ephemerocybe angulata]|uniref:Glycosyl transferase family group 2-domain-containing protein n=1 Tax=Ephemerocybe angulata TaxID=980116 RepID=A0A8H6IG25_9AGAR|nr:glycosyl transferase family group 2-domain-containing protein [Tulosesus angulatus]